MFVVVGVQPPALAADIAHGKQIFTGNCAACHMGGRNTIMPVKNLKKESLEKYLTNFKTKGVDAIVYQVTNGKAAMPNFKRLGPTSIQDVAAYVLDQSEKGW